MVADLALVRVSHQLPNMKLVVSGMYGDHLFSGSSLLTTIEEEAPAETEETRASAPPESGVFPVAQFVQHDDDDGAEPAPRNSGVFPRGADLALENADDECELNLIDAEWGRLSMRPKLRRMWDRPRLRIAG
jgi:hypothetical protein